MIRFGIVIFNLTLCVALPIKFEVSTMHMARLWVPSLIVLVAVFAIPTPTYVEDDGSDLVEYSRKKEL